MIPQSTVLVKSKGRKLICIESAAHCELPRSRNRSEAIRLSLQDPDLFPLCQVRLKGCYHASRQLSLNGDSRPAVPLTDDQAVPVK